MDGLVQDPGERVDVAFGDEPAVHAVLDGVLRAALAGEGDDRDAMGLGLQDHHRQAFIAGGEGEDGSVAIDGVHVFLDTGHFHRVAHAVLVDEGEEVVAAFAVADELQFPVALVLDHEPGRDEPVQGLLEGVAADGDDRMGREGGGILALDAVGDDHHVGKVAPVALVFLGEDDEAVEGMDILGVALVHEPVGHAP